MIPVTLIRNIHIATLAAAMNTFLTGMILSATFIAKAIKFR